MDALIDTQILSTHFKHGSGLLPSGNYISSITANEFLWVYRKDSNKPDYYIFHPSRFVGISGIGHYLYPSEHYKNKKWAKLGAHRTDQIIIDFNNQFPAYKEFGLEAVASIINEHQINIFELSIAHIEKKKRRYLRERIQFLVSTGYKCIPPNLTTASIAMDLFAKFIEQHNSKEDLRNSINDIIILATAAEKKMLLVSKDSLLNRFAAKECNVVLKEVKGTLELDFSAPKSVERMNFSESKGYVNRGWSYSVRNGNSVYGC